MKKHLITGITGQDGIFLVKKILETEDNPIIFGISREVDGVRFYKNLKRLKIENIKNIKLFNLNLNNSLDTSSFIKEYSPDNVYNLTGPVISSRLLFIPNNLLFTVLDVFLTTFSILFP